MGKPWGNHELQQWAWIRLFYDKVTTEEKSSSHFPCTALPHSGVTQFPPHREKHGWSQVGVRRKHYLPPLSTSSLYMYTKHPIHKTTAQGMLCTQQAHTVPVLTSATKDRSKNRCLFSQITTGQMELPPQPTVCAREALGLSYIQKYKHHLQIR